MTTKARVAAGSSRGGQFAATARSEATVTLDLDAGHTGAECAPADRPSVEEALAPALSMNRVQAEQHVRSLLDDAAADGDPQRIDEIASLASGPGWKGVAYVRGYPGVRDPESPATAYLPTKAAATRMAEHAWRQTGEAERRAQEARDPSQDPSQGQAWSESSARAFPNLDPGLYKSDMRAESIRAHAVREGDLLHVDGATERVTAFRVDPPGRPGRQIHVTTEQGTHAFGINDALTVSRGAAAHDMA